MAIAITLLLASAAIPCQQSLAAPTAATITVVKDAKTLRAALENKAGSSIQLGADITFQKSNAFDIDYGAVINGGSHTIDLAGHKLTYIYVDSSGYDKGIPIRLMDGNLTINGTGTVKGGVYGVDGSGNHSVVTYNGGTYTAVIGCGIRQQQGVAILNKGTFSGNFGGLFLEGGCVVNNGATMGKIVDKHRGGVYIQNGTFTGNLILTAPMTIANLTVSAGSSIKVMDRAILNVTGKLSGTERITLEEGILSANGMATVKGRVEVYSNLSLQGLTIPAGAEIWCADGVKLTVAGNLLNNGSICIGKGGDLVVTGTFTNNGTISRLDPPPGINGTVSGTNGTGTAAPAFYDVRPSDWFFPYITELAGAGIVSGFQDNTFRPQETVTWGMALKLILLAAGEDAQQPTNTHWASGYLDRAVALGILDKQVDLNSAVVRLDIASLTANALKLSDPTITSPFDDTTDQAAISLYEANIMQGSYADGTRLFKPADTITRAEISAIVSRIKAK